MTADLGPCPGHGLSVRSHVTLDCRGFSLVGLGNGSEQYGIYLDGDTTAPVIGATVRQCAVSGFLRGIRLRAAQQSVIVDNVAAGNGDVTTHVGYGIDVAVGSSNNVLQGNTIAGNADEGVHFGSDTGPNQFVGNVLYDNYREQIYVLASDGNSFVGNTTYGAGSNSLYLKDSANNRLEGNTFKDRTTKVIGDSTGNVFVDNTFVNSTLQFSVYSATPDRIPTNNSVIGGSMTHTGTCLRFTNTWGNTAADVTQPSCGTQVRSDSTSTEPSSNALVGMAVDSSVVSVDTYSTLSVGWWLDLHVQDAAGQAIADARVQALDATGSVVFDLMTDASGNLSDRTLVEYVRSASSSVTRTPHTLNVSKDGYVSESYAVQMVQDRAMTVALEPDGSVHPSGDGTFFDDFNRPDAAAPGNGWVEAQGDVVVGMGELRTSGAKGYNIAVQPALVGATQSAAADFASSDNSPSPRLGVVLRFKDPRNYYLFSWQPGGTKSLRISKVIGGVETILAGVPTTAIPKNTFFRLAGRVEGTTLTLELNGSAKVVASDAALVTGSPGIFVGSKSTRIYRADNFSASVQ